MLQLSLIMFPNILGLILAGAVGTAIYTTAKKLKEKKRLKKEAELQ